MVLAKQIQELREERAKNVALARKIIQGAESEKRDMNAEERANWDRAIADSEALNVRISSLEKQDTLDRLMDSPVEKPSGLLNAAGSDGLASGRDPAKPFEYAYDLRGKPGAKRRIVAPASAATSVDYAKAFADYLVSGRTWNGKTSLIMEDERGVRAEMTAGNNVTGGYFITPTQMVAGLIQAVDDMLFIRQYATVIAVPDAKSLGQVSLDTDPDDGEWTSEVGDMTFDSSLAFGKRELSPHQLAKGIKISNKLIRQSAVSIESIVQQRFAYKFARVMEANYLTGNGASKPLGLFVASDDGIPTSRDVSTGNTSSSMTFDGLKNARFALKQQYQTNSVWIFHRDALSQIAGLKDGEGRYLWQPSVTQGMPDTVWGRPMIQSELAPNTFTSGQYVGLLGDLSFYHIADGLGMTMQRLIELEARNNKTEFHWRMESDGMPVLGEAFVRVKLG
ncbi:MAG: phage major capsid protein [Planctomycetes bacterium]|nr:phage major capsid protein [Planctomycetota bacterium]